MNIAIWVVQGLLAVVFGMAGSMKLMKTPDEILDQRGEQMAWVRDFTPSQLKQIGIAEVLGAIGLIVPAATKILPWLTPVAVVGLAILMAGAAYTHYRRNETPAIGFTGVLMLLSLFVAYGRFVLEPIS